VEGVRWELIEVVRLGIGMGMEGGRGGRLRLRQLQRWRAVGFYRAATQRLR